MWGKLHLVKKKDVFGILREAGMFLEERGRVGVLKRGTMA